ncbi:putative transcriptional regulator, Lrp family [Aeropyrum pernix K1]|uniref:Transcriptional regulator, Lrp family n=1 Tax=Aeropyrum pernix (strain ATCC 700893 / DSM 11879 / JCM 9820 / NBRC 100138 / K1) TaxID=272557 RepID=Q9YB86_AERPE|nr:winged helix-turn-helix transcriptional regulator [Aeropyrum pernix]BAA80712.1 putative transcriptional regulator, Lrp family [Aeropyrum pernix K1]
MLLVKKAQAGRAIVLVLLMVIAVLAVGQLALAQQEASINSVEVTIRGDGVAEARVQAEAGPGLASIELPAPPIVTTILVTTADGNSIPPIVEGNTLIVPLEEKTSLEVSYIVDTKANNGVFSFDVTPPGVPVKLILEQGIILLGLPSGITSYDKKDGTLEILFSEPSTISYVPAEYAGTQPAETATDGGGEGTGTVTTGAAETTGVKGSWQIAAAIILAAVIIIAGGAVLYMYRKKSGGNGVDAVVTSLDSTDKLILDTLKNAGGTSEQPALLKATGLPKSTLWRRLRKLEAMGYVRIIKKGKSNVVELVKHYEKEQEE